MTRNDGAVISSTSLFWIYPGCVRGCWLWRWTCGTEPVCKCKGAGLPRCYVCSGNDKAHCESSQVLTTCPSDDVWKLLI